jgi:hypothetical protein
LKYSFLLLFLACSFYSCCLIEGGCEPPVPSEDTVALPTFESNPVGFSTPLDVLNETSGIVAARNQPDALWVQEDSGNKVGIHLLGTNGAYKKFVFFPGSNRDWEDIAIGPGPEASKNYIYLADIGDNNQKYSEYYIQRFLEPEATQTEVVNFDTIKFKYPNGKSYDAETIMIDPKTKDLYIVTKTEFNVNVFRLRYPQATDSINEAEFLGVIPYFQIVGGDISSDGNEIVMKNYFSVFYWRLKANETIYQAISRTRDLGVPYIIEPQGEAICWSQGAKGIYTLSERASNVEAPKLYYYAKK